MRPWPWLLEGWPPSVAAANCIELSVPNPLGEGRHIKVCPNVLMDVGAVVHEEDDRKITGDLIAVVGDVQLRSDDYGSYTVAGAGLADPCEPYSAVPEFECVDTDPIGNQEIRETEPKFLTDLVCVYAADYNVYLDDDGEPEYSIPGYWVESPLLFTWDSCSGT